MIKRGHGIGCMFYGVGNTGLPNPAAAFVEVLMDGTANVMVGAADIGQGSDTVCANIAAETLGMEFHDIHVSSADTLMTPEGGATSASRQTFVTGNAVKNACLDARKEMEKTAAELLECEPDDLIFAHREVKCASDESKKVTLLQVLDKMRYYGRLAVGAGYYNPKTTYLNPANMEGIPFEIYSYATTIAEVDVNTETGEVTVRKVVSAHDVGTVVNRHAVEGQIEGGVVMGEGFVLFENIEVNQKTGAIKNPEMSKYIIPTTMDVPVIYPICVESDGDAAPYGAKGVGEPALIPMIPAVKAAVEDALGVVFDHTPILKPDIMAAIKKKEAEEAAAKAAEE